MSKHIHAVHNEMRIYKCKVTSQQIVGHDSMDILKPNILKPGIRCPQVLDKNLVFGSY